MYRPLRKRMCNHDWTLWRDTGRRPFHNFRTLRPHVGLIICLVLASPEHRWMKSSGKGIKPSSEVTVRRGRKRSRILYSPSPVKAHSTSAWESDSLTYSYPALRSCIIDRLAQILGLSFIRIMDQDGDIDHCSPVIS